MSEQYKLVIDILKAFHREGVLEDMILIGSWCHYFYAMYYKHPPEIPAVRTLNIDFLVPFLRNVKKKVNVPGLLEGFDFKMEVHRMNGLVKFVHPDLKLEFLAPMRGRGQEKPYDVQKFSVNAVGLRMLEMLYVDPLHVSHEGFVVRVPQPAAYALHKFLINKRCGNPEKKVKDLDAAIADVLKKAFPELNDYLSKE